MDQIAPRFEHRGFTLSELATHNVGSHNRLVVLSDSYLELLGWPSGDAPPRAEIVGSPLGFDAIVFRTDDADATYERLHDDGFAVNPVQALTRPAIVGGRQVEARFATVRFAVQPIRGFRVYYCQHLTPECVWQPRLMAHRNGATKLRRIDVQAHEPAAIAELLRRLAGGGDVGRAAHSHEVAFANTTIRVAPGRDASEAALVGVTLGTASRGEVALDLTAASLA